MTTRKNRLAGETSPYLLAYANQTIDWYPWCDEAFIAAERDKKLIFISIGYSACHWCHEISRNCFENETIANILNQYYICIKVDKEERPDVDQFYMSALQLMSDSGGWPISCFALPDGSPIFGGTYFPPDEFAETLLGLQETYSKETAKVEDMGRELMKALDETDIIKSKSESTDITLNDVHLIIETWRLKLDHINGGTQSLPKFPLPTSILFLMVASYFESDTVLAKYVDTSLQKMAEGGIYDQLAGGFFRYTTDSAWHFPHFEKMLYDNALIMYVYSLAYRNDRSPLYEKVVRETSNFLVEHMQADNKLFYCSVDADTDREEGAFYTWTSEELKQVLGNNARIAFDLLGAKEEGNFKGKNVLYISNNIEEIARKYGITADELTDKLEQVKQLLLERRKTRVSPRIDTKIILSWNAYLIKAFCEAYKTFNNPQYLTLSIEMADSIRKHYIRPDFMVYRMLKDNGNSLPGFLDDYVSTAIAFMQIYTITGDESYLVLVDGLLDYMMAHFYDETSGMFFYTADNVHTHLPRKMDFIDRACPSSNSEVARLLIIVALIKGKDKYEKIAKQMICNIKSQMSGAGPYIANWGMLLYLNIYKLIVALIPKQYLGKIINQYRGFRPNLRVFPQLDNWDYNKEGKHHYCYPLKKLIAEGYAGLAEFAAQNKNKS
jgi:uncharacterized protein YyaL (SSP411 family)